MGVDVRENDELTQAGGEYRPSGRGTAMTRAEFERLRALGQQLPNMPSKPMLATIDFSDLNSFKNGNNKSIRQIISRGSNPMKLDQTSIRSRLNVSHVSKRRFESIRHSVHITNYHEASEMVSPMRETKALMMASFNQGSLKDSFMNDTGFSKNPLSNTSFLPPADLYRTAALRTPISSVFSNPLSPVSTAQGKRDLATPTYRAGFIGTGLQRRSRDRNHSNLEANKVFLLSGTLRKSLV